MFTRLSYARAKRADKSAVGARVLIGAPLNQDSLPTTLARLLLRSQASCKECAPLRPLRVAPKIGTRGFLTLVFLNSECYT